MHIFTSVQIGIRILSYANTFHQTKFHCYLFIESRKKCVFSPKLQCSISFFPASKSNPSLQVHLTLTHPNLWHTVRHFYSFKIHFNSSCIGQTWQSLSKAEMFLYTHFISHAMKYELQGVYRARAVLDCGQLDWSVFENGTTCPDIAHIHKSKYVSRVWSRLRLEDIIQDLVATY